MNEITSKSQNEGPRTADILYAVALLLKKLDLPDVTRSLVEGCRGESFPRLPPTPDLAFLQAPPHLGSNTTYRPIVRSPLVEELDTLRPGVDRDILAKRWAQVEEKKEERNNRDTTLKKKEIEFFLRQRSHGKLGLTKQRCQAFQLESLKVPPVEKKLRFANVFRAHGPETGALAVATSPDGRFVATRDGKVARIWNARTMKVVETLLGLDGAGTNLIWSSDSTLLAAESTDVGSITVWDVNESAIYRRLILTGDSREQGDDNWHMEFAAGTHLLSVTAGSLQEILIWELDGSVLNGGVLVDVKSCLVLPHKAANGNTERLKAAKWHRDGKTLATLTGNFLRIWSVDTDCDDPEGLTPSHAISVRLGPNARPMIAWNECDVDFYQLAWTPGAGRLVEIVTLPLVEGAEVRKEKVEGMDKIGLRGNYQIVHRRQPNESPSNLKAMGKKNIVAFVHALNWNDNRLRMTVHCQHDVWVSEWQVIQTMKNSANIDRDENQILLCPPCEGDTSVVRLPIVKYSPAGGRVALMDPRTSQLVVWRFPTDRPGRFNTPAHPDRPFEELTEEQEGNLAARKSQLVEFSHNFNEEVPEHDTLLQSLAWTADGTELFCVLSNGKMARFSVASTLGVRLAEKSGVRPWDNWNTEWLQDQDSEWKLMVEANGCLVSAQLTAQALEGERKEESEEVGEFDLQSSQRDQTLLVLDESSSTSENDETDSSSESYVPSSPTSSSASQKKKRRPQKRRRRRREDSTSSLTSTEEGEGTGGEESDDQEVELSQGDEDGEGGGKEGEAGEVEDEEEGSNGDGTAEGEDEGEEGEGGSSEDDEPPPKRRKVTAGGRIEDEDWVRLQYAISDDDWTPTTSEEDD